MEIGTIVKSKAGRDKESFLVVIGKEGESVLVADGKERPLEKPKKKNMKHLASTNTIVGEENLSTNKKIKIVLREYRAN